MTAKPGAKAPEQRRGRIMAATVDVIRRRGFAGTRVADIAAEAGTSSGLVLYHFGSLAGALAEALTGAEDAFYASLDARMGAATGPVERLMLMARLGAGSGPAVGDWTLWLELWVRALRDETARAARESLDGRWRSALREVIDEGDGDGHLRARGPGCQHRAAGLPDGRAGDPAGPERPRDDTGPVPPVLAGRGRARTRGARGGVPAPGTAVIASRTS